MDQLSNFSPYVWPYPPGPVFGGLLVFALVLQLLLAAKAPRLRRLLPILGGLILVSAIPAGLLIPPQAGVFFGEFDTMFTISLPGWAILLGSALGSLFRRVYQHLK